MGDYHFLLVDTGGLGTLNGEKNVDLFDGMIREQVTDVIQDAAVLVWVVNCQDGITPQDGLIEMFDNWINEWEYPNIGIPFGQTESAGHDMYFMDFGSVDENGEPRIVLVDNEFDNCVTEVAKNLEEFLTKIYNREEI